MPKSCEEMFILQPIVSSLYQTKLISVPDLKEKEGNFRFNDTVNTFQYPKSWLLLTANIGCSFGHFI